MDDEVNEIHDWVFSFLGQGTHKELCCAFISM
jgi:hypothetical protein